MNRLPLAEKLEVTALNACFNNTTATYKFYWLLAILETVESNKNRIPKKELFARMLALSWHTVNYFHLSFGEFDKLQASIKEIKTLINIDLDKESEHILGLLIHSEDPRVAELLNHFDKNVPHKFLSPWFGSESMTAVYAQSKEADSKAPYQLERDEIIVKESWANYFKTHANILKSFCYWHLTLFLQVRNPNVPDISAKLMRPANRKNLIKQKRDFWNIVIQKNGPIKCIYTGNELIDDYAVDHFIPFQFVAHDQIWNLIPADKHFNLKKGDKLPRFEKYFDPFYNLQKIGFETIQDLDPKNKFIQEYYNISRKENFEKIDFADTIQSMLKIANNNGFDYLNYEHF